MSETHAVAVPVPSLPAAATAAATATAAGVPRLTDKVRSALLRAARTFTQSFIAVLTASPVLDLNIPTLKAAAAAGLAAVLSLVQRWLDDTPVWTIPTG